jgi:hypothetical protein
MSAIDTAVALLLSAACMVLLSFGCIAILAVLLKK